MDKKQYFLNTQFIEDGRLIELISIGIVSSDNRELYLGNISCPFWQASPWVKDNVLTPMPDQFTSDLRFLKQPIDQTFWREKKDIAAQIIEFLGVNPTEKLEFWSYYSATHWVAFYQVFGPLMDLPKPIPQHCNDLKQECDRLEVALYYKDIKQECEVPRPPAVTLQLPPKPKDSYSALANARWNKQAYELLMSLE